jgi:hypothetical protein
MHAAREPGRLWLGGLWLPAAVIASDNSGAVLDMDCFNSIYAAIITVFVDFMFNSYRLSIPVVIQ